MFHQQKLRYEDKFKPSVNMFDIYKSLLFFTCRLNLRLELSSGVEGHLLLRKLQNSNSLLNSRRQENVGSHQKNIRHIQGQRRSLSKMVGGVKSHLEQTFQRHSEGSNQNLCVPGNSTDWARPAFECLSVSCVGWSAVACHRDRGSGSADLGMT